LVFGLEAECASEGAGVLVASATQFPAIKNGTEAEAYSPESHCEMCGNPEENLIYVILHCPVAKRFWAEVKKILWVVYSKSSS